jgi:hypothetical protein
VFYCSPLLRFNKPEEEVEIERSTSPVRLLPPPTPAPYPFHDPFPIHKGQFAGGSVSPYPFQFSEELSPTPSPLALQLLGKVFKNVSLANDSVPRFGGKFLADMKFSNCIEQPVFIK